MLTFESIIETKNIQEFHVLSTTGWNPDKNLVVVIRYFCSTWNWKKWLHKFWSEWCFRTFLYALNTHRHSRLQMIC